MVGGSVVRIFYRSRLPQVAAERRMQQQHIQGTGLSKGSEFSIEYWEAKQTPHHWYL